MCAPRIRTITVVLPLTILVIWFIGVDPVLLFRPANLFGNSAPQKVWHERLSQPSVERVSLHAQSELNPTTGEKAGSSADLQEYAQTRTDSEGTQHMAATRTALRNAYANLSDSCRSAFWAPKSRECRGAPQMPSSLALDKVKKHKHRLKEPTVVRFHSEKCAYDDTASALKTELAIILMPISIVESGYALQDRINMLISAYHSHFVHIAIVGAKLNFTGSLEDDVTIWPCDKTDDTHAFAYICVARFLVWVMKQSQSAKFSGFSFFHTDFWLHPSHLAASLSKEPKAIISLSMPTSREGWPNFHSYAADFTDHVCCGQKDFWKSRFHKDQKNHGNIRQSGSPEQGYIHDPSNMMWKTFHRIDQALFSSALENAAVCYGWADMFRLPKDLWEPFSKYAMFFADVPDTRDKHHEVVIPTLLHKLAVHSKRSVQMLECWGGTIAYTFKKTVLELYPCGHRMQLQMPSVRFDFVDAVRCG